MAQVRVEQLTKTFGGGVRAVEDISFTADEGQIVTLLGPSGCGKTTILRCIAGLEAPTMGRIVIGEKVVHDGATGRAVPVEERAIGMVFQSYAIWPHLNVFDNVAFALKIGGKQEKKTESLRAKVLEVLQSVGMEGFEKRYPSELSGGQQQRVVLARALVYRPRLLLLDEPLANLDAKLREAMRLELRDVQQRYGLTTIYVTHDQAEAMALSDQVIVLRAGKILSQGTPREIFTRPKHPFVAEFLGVSNRIEGRIAEARTDNLVKVIIEGMDQPIAVIGEGNVEDQVLVAIRPSDVELHRNIASSQENTLPGRIARVTFLGEELDCLVRVGDVTLRARDSAEKDWRSGEQVQVRLSRKNLMLLRPDFMEP